MGQLDSGDDSLSFSGEKLNPRSVRKCVRAERVMCRLTRSWEARETAMTGWRQSGRYPTPPRAKRCRRIQRRECYVTPSWAGTSARM